VSTAFASDVRVLLCDRCGAPLDAPLGGGSVRCHFCGAEVLIAPRVQAVTSWTGDSVPTAQDEKQRVQRLRLQEVAANPSPYDLRVRPAGLEWIAATYATPEALATAVPALETALREEMQRAASARSIESEGRVFYVASVLENAVSLASSDPLRLRAHLESVRDSFADAGFRQLATCRLAGQARHGGDLAAAEGWLRQCDPVPRDLALDTAYRIARAGVQLGRLDDRGALETLGARAGKVPISLSWKPAAQMLRVHALERVGDQAAADAEYDEATGWKGAATWLPAMVTANKDLGELCGKTIARWQASHPEGAVAAERAGVEHAVRRRRLRRLRLGALLLVVLALVAWRLLACTGVLES
jgi:predicted negative regulator of RcsB-dependent stress response/DNA-directed RNA polymerase subunit RPC12/RpoP